MFVFIGGRMIVFESMIDVDLGYRTGLRLVQRQRGPGGSVILIGIRRRQLSIMRFVMGVLFGCRVRVAGMSDLTGITRIIRGPWTLFGYALGVTLGITPAGESE